tara:strand:+ start:747 stop:1274 length:528 start_codon:yes stop_codon:yes gene_type:complete
MLDLKVFKDGYEVSGSMLAKSEKNDCMVRACANAFEIDYDQAHAFVGSRFNRKNRTGTKNAYDVMKEMCKEVTCFEPTDGTQLDLFKDTTNKEYEIKYVGSEPKKGGKLINRKYKHKPVAYTVKTFMQKYTKGTYLLLVNKHALVVKDGVVVDNSNYRFNGYRRTVESAFKIENA